MLRGLEPGNHYPSITECKYDQVRSIVDPSDWLKHNQLCKAIFIYIIAINKIDGNENQESNRGSNYIIIHLHERQDAKVVVYQVLYPKSNFIQRYTSISPIL